MTKTTPAAKAATVATVAAKAAAPKGKAAKAAKAAPAAKVDPDLITSVSAVKSGETSTVAVMAGKATLMIKAELQSKAVLAAAAKGKSFAALTALVDAQKLASKPTMARGLANRAAPHSAKAVSDARAKEAAPVKAAKAPATPRAAKAECAKTEHGNRSTAGIVSTRNGDQKITVVAKASPYKPGSKADETFGLFAKAKTVAGFKELVALNPSKYDAGYIRYSARDGFIAVG